MPRPDSVRHYRACFSLLTAVLSGFLSLPANGEIFISESAWRETVGTFTIETWEEFSPGTPINLLPSLGIEFLLLDEITFPSAQPVVSSGGTGGTVRSGSQVLFNGIDVALPGLGPIEFVTTGSPLFGVGYWNTGGNDETQVSVFDSAGALIESATVGGGVPAKFIGIVSSTPIFRVRIEAVGVEPDGYFTIDDLQTALGEGVVEPPVLTGDGNGDGMVNAADLVALILEISDNDGEDVADVAAGTFAGTTGLDVNDDGKVNLDDLTPLAELIFGP